MSADPYKYFRPEARELVENLTRGILELEKGRGDSDLISRLLRHAHTLKGAARIVKQVRISELSHSIEEVLASARENPARVSTDRIAHLLAWIDQITSEVTALGPASVPETQPVPAEPTSGTQRTASAPEPWDERFRAVRVEVTEMDALLRGLSELRVQMSGLSRQAENLGRIAKLAEESAHGESDSLARSLKSIHQRVGSILDRASRQLSGLCDQAASMRLVPANSIFGLLQRAARDAAEATGRQVLFDASGGDTRLDAHGLRLLRNALTHLVRNAVVHGIEPPTQRSALGKPPAGLVRIRVERRGERALFFCSDDGRGVDLQRVREVVLERKMTTATEAERLTPASAMALLFRGGITTASGVSEVSGRGIGLDVVRDAVACLGGAITTRTEPGKGTEIEISVPVQVESQHVLHLECGGRTVSVPQAAVREALRLASGDVAESPEGETIVVGGQAVGFAMLDRLLDGGHSRLPASLSALVLQSQSGVAAVGVDHVVGREEVLIRPMPEILGPIPVLSGAFLDSEGNPQLVLSADGLIRKIWSGLPVAPEIEPARHPPLLVIDDSLTTRMLEQGILETAGYEVDAASSGEVALEMARRRRYGLFIVDVEMPGMDGFQFIEAARNDPEIGAIPSVVVTSRDSAEDQARGVRAGAKAYIVKSRFDEQSLLKTIQDLIG